MKRLLRYRLSLLLILISLSVSGQTLNSKNNSALIAAAIKKFNDPKGADPMKTYSIINDLMIIKNIESTFGSMNTRVTTMNNKHVK